MTFKLCLSSRSCNHHKSEESPLVKRACWLTQLFFPTSSSLFWCKRPTCISSNSNCDILIFIHSFIPFGKLISCLVLLPPHCTLVPKRNVHRRCYIMKWFRSSPNFPCRRGSSPSWSDAAEGIPSTNHTCHRSTVNSLKPASLDEHIKFQIHLLSVARVTLTWLFHCLKLAANSLCSDAWSRLN